MDLGAAYRAAVEARAPQAQKVFDRFHVQKLANEAVDTVRRQEVGLLGEATEGRALKKSRWALLKNPWNLTLRQGQKLSEVARTNKRLYRAYHYCVRAPPGERGGLVGCVRRKGGWSGGR